MALLDGYDLSIHKECPSISLSVIPSYCPYPEYIVSGAYNGGYKDYFDTTKPPQWRSTSMAEISNTAGSVMIWEMGDVTPGQRYGAIGVPSNIPRYPKEGIVHLEGMNLTFGDGHVKWMSYQSLIASTGPYVGTKCNVSAPTHVPTALRCLTLSSREFDRAKVLLLSSQ